MFTTQIGVRVIFCRRPFFSAGRMRVISVPQSPVHLIVASPAAGFGLITHQSTTSGCARAVVEICYNIILCASAALLQINNS
jgi:hypothetical protein